MKVNISGRGLIPGLNRLAPVYGVDLSEKEVSRLINYRQFKVYSTETGLLITRKNIANVFMIKSSVITPKEETPVIEIPKIVEEVKIVEEPIVEEVKIEPTVVTEDTITEEVIQVTEEEITEKEITEEAPMPAFLRITEIKSDTFDEDDKPINVSEEVKDEKPKSYYNKKNKYKKH